MEDNEIGGTRSKTVSGKEHMKFIGQKAGGKGSTRKT
jgi:hypothetical protein